ncbi:MAG: hypothetical protein KDE31_38300, partial [Caldilineaceae bacterium]|nr:hypothetical protein [Caldilineaceae bacterium]
MTENFSTQVQTAWQRQDLVVLANLMRLGHGHQWRQGGLEFFDVMAELNAPVARVLDLTNLVDRKLRYQWTHALMWRIFATPRVLQLQDAASFSDTSLVAATPGSELPVSWSTGALWVGQWAKRLVDYYTGYTDVDRLAQVDELGLFRSPTGAGFPPIFHPLTLLGVQKTMLSAEKTPQRASFDLALGRWLTTNGVTTLPDNATIETSLAAGATVLALANRYGVTMAPDKISGDGPWVELVETVLERIVTLCEGAAQRPGDSDGQVAKVITILEAGPAWHETQVAGYLRNSALARMQDQLAVANSTLAAADVELSTDRFNPVVDAVSLLSLPDRLAATGYLDAGYLSVLQGIRQAETDLRSQTVQLLPAIHAARQAHAAAINAVSSPLVQAAL